MVKHIQRMMWLLSLVFIVHTPYSFGEKTAVLVVGAPRSGTSCVSGVLDILGVDFGDNFYPNSASQYNPKGDFEDKSFDSFSRKICRELDLHPQHPRFINWDKEPKKDQYKKNIKQFIKDYKHENSFGLKIPLMSLLMPLYLGALEELGYTTKIVCVIRNPNEIMQSCYDRWGNPREMIYASIATYYFNFLRYVQGQDALVIYFDDVIHNIESVVDQIHQFIPGLKNYSTARDELAQFIDSELKHHNAG